MDSLQILVVDFKMELESIEFSPHITTKYKIIPLEYALIIFNKDIFCRRSEHNEMRHSFGKRLSHFIRSPKNKITFYQIKETMFDEVKKLYAQQRLFLVPDRPFNLDHDYYCRLFQKEHDFDLYKIQLER